MLRAGTNITFDFKVTSQPWFTCEQCNSELQSEGKKVRLMLCVHCAKRCHDGHRGIKYLRTSKVACMCFECCDCILMKEVEQKAREEGIVPLNRLARYEADPTALPIAPLRCTQPSGTALFVPSGWKHAIINEEASVGVAVEVGDLDVMARAERGAG